MDDFDMDDKKLELRIWTVHRVMDLLRLGLVDEEDKSFLIMANELYVYITTGHCVEAKGK